MSFSAVKDLAGSSWQRQPYGVKMPQSFANYKAAAIEALTQVYMSESGVDAAEAKSKAEEEFQAQNEGDAANTFDIPTVSDCSLYGNDVINPYAGFCLDDDIVHEMYKQKGHDYGMGRVYREMYDSKQQVLYMQFGLPKYRNMQDWLSSAASSEMGQLNDTGNVGLLTKFANLILGGVKLAIKLPWLPIEWCRKAIRGLEEDQITEYFYFKETMLLYYRYVNTLLAHIAVGMGLYGSNAALGFIGKDVQQDIVNPDLIPEALKGGPDIFHILTTRSRRFGISKYSATGTDEMLKQHSQEDPPEGVWASIKSFFVKIWDGWSSTAMDGCKFIAFRIEKGADNASETFSNSTQESSMAQRLNASVAENRERNLNTNQGEGIGANLLRGLSTVKNFYSKAKDAVGAFKSGDLEGGINGVIDYVAAGNGFFDLPKQWCGSNFSRNFNVSLKLRSKTGGDPVSIFQNIMIPLSCLLAGSMPRAAGNGTYTSPFICRCWCRGMFSIPAGIIQSLSVTRGDSEFGWSLSRQPTVVNVNMVIEDLSPILYVGLTGDSFSDVWGSAFRDNTKLHEYLDTLTGVGLRQRYYRLQQLKRTYYASKLISKNTMFSATYWSMRLGDSWIGKLVGAVSPMSAMRVGQ